MSEYENSADVFAAEDDFELPNNAAKTIRRLWISLNNQRARLAAVLASVILYTVLSIAAPAYSAHTVDVLWNNIVQALSAGTVFRITWANGGRELAALLLLYAAAAGFYMFQSLIMASFAETLTLRLRTEIGRKLARLPLSYFDRTKTGAILSRAVSDLDKTSEALQTGILKLFTASGMIIGSLCMMFRFSRTLTVIFLAVTGIALGATKIVSAKTLRYTARRQQCVSTVTALIEEAYSGRVIIKSFNQEENSSRTLHEAAEELAQASKKADFIINAINPAIRLITRIGHVLLAVFAGKMLLDGTMSIGVFQAFFQYVHQASEPLTEAAYVINSMQSALASVERVYELLDEQEIPDDTGKLSYLPAVRGAVEFRNVRFGYTASNVLMQCVSFSAAPGQKIAIVGSTGAGKTTLINLLMRFYELNGGHILLDGTDITHMSRAALRNSFGMVLQDTWLFGGTIAENIAYGKPDAGRQEIIAAAKAARADFFIRTMPDGYDTVLNTDTENISAGQRQLLTIARAFLCNPAVIILDEATSSVDTRTEQEIGKAMKALMKGRTSFVIAHRLSTITDADLILFMQHGDIIEQGTHTDLLKKHGAYAELYYSQFT
ncbi:MAG TPA: ABC transporter ATP-binding protein/permease [Candidatus Treponema faecavium]|nr:ABC transporter ATP-binding protein/permease [Candidatus Treponema faecavium]